MDLPRSRVIAALVSAVVAAGVAAGCAEWQAQVAQERGIPFGTGEYDGQVVAQSGLHVRAGPSTNAASQVILADGTELRITCQAQGETIEGDPTWYRLGERRWVSARYVANVGPAPEWCD